MENYKPMDTPLATNWRKENGSLGEAVDRVDKIKILLFFYSITFLIPRVS